MDSLNEAMRHAANLTDMRDYVTAVKSAARRAVSQLDEAVDLEDTHYFNHSAVPDFVMKWTNRPSRPMYLRRSFEEIRATEDVSRLADKEPVVVSLNEEVGDSRAEHSLREELSSNAHTRRILITGSRAIASLTEATQTDSPLRRVIGSELLPQGRGLLDESAAGRLGQPTASISEDLADFLSEKAMSTVRETALIMEAALSAEAPHPSLRGQLSATEAQQLLPWLLASPDVRKDRPFWSAIGEALTLKTLEQVARHLSGLDLSPLLFSMWGKWQAKRAYRGVPELTASGEPVDDGWSMNERGLLTLHADGAAVRFSTDGRSLAGKGSLSSATWAKIEPRLGSLRLLEITLRGISRSILLNANQSPDVRGDASRIHESLDDTYYVDDLRIQAGKLDEDRTIRIDLGSDLAFNEGNASLKDLSMALLAVAQYNNPLDMVSLDSAEDSE